VPVRRERTELLKKPERFVQEGFGEWDESPAVRGFKR
jgi:hypothetical protein